ncbi:MAG: tryptophan synthase subunit alpha, partial [Methanomicrobiales archaeon]|nr:tryptophan synthase subunit alpha [Methanomicrobiales archaeon]
MSRLESVFSGRRPPAFIAFLVAGDPDRNTSAALARSIIDAGADVLELGMPFSDPIADGPTIQKADDRALASGMTPDHLFGMIREIRTYSAIPLVILTYYNIVYSRGIDRFYQEAAASGLDAILIVDLPPEESDEAVHAAGKNGIDQIFLVSETTSDERLEMILSRAGGFLYLVSTLGVTGARQELSPNIVTLLTRVKQGTDLPVAVGFGISRPEQVESLIRAGADAVIVGSAIVQHIEMNLGDAETIRQRI